jgi:hypothetical protein
MLPILFGLISSSGWEIDTHHETVQQHFLVFGDLLKSVVHKQYRHVIWLATTWCIWRWRNHIVFRGERVNISTLVDQIIYMSWFWFTGRLRSNVDISFDTWCNNPIHCLQSG